MAGLIDNSAPMGGGKYDDLIKVDPKDDPFEATEPATEEEQAHYDELYADFMDKLYAGARDRVVRQLKNHPQLFQSVSTAAFTVLKATYMDYTRANGEVPQAALFGEGGMISTAVDEVFKLAKIHNLEGSADMNQYTAAQMNMMKLVGEEIENRQEDGAVEETQDLLIDAELAYNPDAAAGPVSPRDRRDLNAIEFQEEARQPAGAENPAEQQAEQSPAASAPAEQGLI